MSRESLSLRFPARYDTNWAVQPQKMARGLKFQINEVEGFYYLCEKKALISCADNKQLICAFVFQYAKHRFYSMTRLVLLLDKKLFFIWNTDELFMHWFCLFTHLDAYDVFRLNLICACS